MLLLLVGVVCCAVAALLIRASETPAVLIAAYRQLIAAALLFPAYATCRKRYPEIPLRRLCRQALPASILLTMHFWSWNIGVHMTPIANATLIVNLTPVLMPFVIWFMVREKITRPELAGTALALLGTAILSAADYRIDIHHLIGDVVCFLSMVALAVYLAWNRRAALPSIWLYVPLVYTFSGLQCLLAGAVTAPSLMLSDSREWLLMLALAIIPTIVGHTILNHSMRVMRSQLVAITTLGQFIPAGILAWFIFDERPGLALFIAATLVVAGVVTAHRPRTRP
jgi:drug/metabolite transporter (DMT)-like permease